MNLRLFLETRFPKTKQNEIRNPPALASPDRVLACVGAQRGWGKFAIVVVACTWVPGRLWAGGRGRDRLGGGRQLGGGEDPQSSSLGPGHNRGAGAGRTLGRRRRVERQPGGQRQGLRSMRAGTWCSSWSLFQSPGISGSARVSSSRPALPGCPWTDSLDRLFTSCEGSGRKALSSF